MVCWFTWSLAELEEDFNMNITIYDTALGKRAGEKVISHNNLLFQKVRYFFDAFFGLMPF